VGVCVFQLGFTSVVSQSGSQSVSRSDSQSVNK